MNLLLYSDSRSVSSRHGFDSTGMSILLNVCLRCVWRRHYKIVLCRVVTHLKASKLLNVVSWIASFDWCILRHDTPWLCNVILALWSSLAFCTSLLSDGANASSRSSRANPQSVHRATLLPERLRGTHASQRSRSSDLLPSQLFRSTSTWTRER